MCANYTRISKLWFFTDFFENLLIVYFLKRDASEIGKILQQTTI